MNDEILQTPEDEALCERLPHHCSCRSKNDDLCPPCRAAARIRELAKLVSNWTQDASRHSAANLKLARRLDRAEADRDRLRNELSMVLEIGEHWLDGDILTTPEAKRDRQRLREIRAAELGDV